MGRFATFNTGFEYKFAFAIQSSWDITEFYGNCIEDSFHVTWTAEEDKEKIQTKLDNLQKTKKFLPEILLDQFKPSTQGTIELYYFLHEKNPFKTIQMERNPTSKEKLFYKYLLGCLIYHQLSYVDTLECDFEG